MDGPACCSDLVCCRGVWRLCVFQGGNEMSNLEKMLIRIMMVLVVLSLTLCSIAFAYLLVSGEHVREALSFTVVLLVASIPIAIEIVCTTTHALGSRELARDGAIVSRLAAIEDMAGMDMLCSDKTGTLTLNKMVIQEHTPVYVEGETQYSILRYAAMAAKWKEPPRDALDTLVLTSVDLPSLDKVRPHLSLSPPAAASTAVMSDSLHISSRCDEWNGGV